MPSQSAQGPPTLRRALNTPKSGAVFVAKLCKGVQWTLANALLDLKRPAEALANYDRAIALEPDFVEALVNRAAALIE